MSIPADKSDGYVVSRTPAANIAISQRSAEWVKRFCAIIAAIKLEYGAYGEPMFVGVPTTPKKVYRGGSGGHFAPLSGKKYDTAHVPLKFEPSSGGDEHANVWGPDFGWEFWWEFQSKDNTNYLQWLGLKALALLQQGVLVSDSDVMAATLAHIAIDQPGNDGYFCPGMPRHLTTITADEIDSGVIDHLAGLTIPNIMGGKVAPRDKAHLNVDQADMGNANKFACAPVRLIEGGDQPGNAQLGIAMGQRYFLNPTKWTPQRHAAFVQAKPKASQHAADTIVRNLVSHGYSPNQSQLKGSTKTSISLDPNEAARLTTLGVTPDLLNGVDWTCLDLLDPPTAVYPDGTTGNREGPCTSFGYP